MNKVAIGLLICTTAFAGACGKVDSVKGAKQAIKSTDLTHKWEQQKCETNLLKKILDQGSSKTSYEFSGNTVEKTEHYFNSGDCTNPEVDVTYIGTFNKKDKVPGDAHQVDIHFKKVKVTPRTQAIADDYNAKRKCGKADWLVNVANNVTTSTRDHNCQVDSLPQWRYDIYRTVNDQLYFGTNASKNTPAERPIEIDPNDPYKKR